MDRAGGCPAMPCPASPGGARWAQPAPGDSRFERSSELLIAFRFFPFTKYCSVRGTAAGSTKAAICPPREVCAELRCLPQVRWLAGHGWQGGVGIPLETEVSPPIREKILHGALLSIW